MTQQHDEQHMFENPKKLAAILMGRKKQSIIFNTSKKEQKNNNEMKYSRVFMIVDKNNKSIRKRVVVVAYS